MAASAAEHGDFKKGDLSDTFGMKAIGMAAKATALYFGFFMIDSFLDYGMIHSELWAESPLAGMSHEFLKPVTESMGAFFADGIGADALTMFETVLKGIHRVFGVDDTFLESVASTVGAAPDLGGSLVGEMGAGAVDGTAVDFSDDVDLLNDLTQG